MTASPLQNAKNPELVQKAPPIHMVLPYANIAVGRNQLQPRPSTGKEVRRGDERQCRHGADCRPEEAILVDIRENNL
jgi:hypothetical protein